VQLVGELVQHQIPPVRRICCAAFRFVPGNYQRAKLARSMTKQSVRALLPNLTLKVTVLVRLVARRVNQNGDQPPVIICFAMKQKKTRLRGKRYMDFFVELNATAAFKILLR